MEQNTSQVIGQWDSVKKNFAESITKMFPVTGRKNVLEIQDLTFDETKAHPSDIRAQEQAKHEEKTWGIPVFAKFVLKDKTTGQVLNESRQKIAVMPRLTPRDTYIVGGGEWNSAYQWRLKSGIYAMVKENGALETEFNLNGAGKDFARENRLKIPFDPESKVFKFKYGTVSAPLYSMLKAADVSDEEMEKAWGKDIFAANKKKNWQQDIVKLYNGKLKKRGLVAESDSFEHIKEAVKKELHKAEVLPDTTKLTLGKEVKNLSGQALLDGSLHILNVAKGGKPDDVYSLYFKHLLGLDDFIAEKFGASKTAQAIKAKIRNTIDKRDRVSQIIPADLFSKPLSQVFIGNALSQRPDQTNPLDIMSSSNITTIQGPGGISSEHAIRNPMKTISQSHLAMLDPILTPEGESTGITLHIPIGTKKIGREARTLVYDTLHKKFDYISAAQMHGDYTVMPDQVKWKMGTPVPISKAPPSEEVSTYRLGTPSPKGTNVTALDPKTHEFVEVPFEKARYILPSPRNLFSEATNLIPFLQCNQGNRTMTGSRQPSQGVPLKYREAPLVQVQSNNPEESFEKNFGRRFSHQSPAEGKVVDIVRDKLGNAEEVHVQDTAGKVHKVQIYNNFPLNDKKSFLHAEPSVQIGQEVKKGQHIADTNFSKEGVLAVGTNMKTGYFPYGSFTFEDGVVVSESGAKKLTSEHMHKTSLELDPKNDQVSLGRFLSHISTVGKKLKKEKLANLDENGIIKPGSVVKPGDLLVAAVSKNTLEGQLGSMTSKLKGAVSSYKDKSLVWDHDYEGKVVKVIPKPGDAGYTVYVRTSEPAKIGDKICGRAGDKNIIGAIIPDSHMPRTGGKDGEIFDLITAPSGVVSRINIGQIMEMGASKIAKATGKPYVTTNFAPGIDYQEKIKKDMVKLGLSDKEKVYDPLLGKEVEGEVLTGHKYIMKQKHQVEKKESVRGLDQAIAGKYSVNFDPQRGKGEGAQAISPLDFYALLAHGARANLKEMSSYKAELQHDPNSGIPTGDDFWNRVMLGIPLPPPKPTFAYRKLEGYLTALGLNLKKEGNETILTPLTDKGVLALSKGEIKNADQTRGKDDQEIKGGLFDPIITGGLPNLPGKGRFWSHHTLAEPMPNPLFVGSLHLPGPAVVLSGLPFKEFDQVVKGEKTIPVNGKELIGGKAIEALLKKVDVQKELEAIKKELPTLKGPVLNKANKRAKFLQALDRLKMRPEEAYIMNHIPILPPMFRPVTTLPDGSTTSADANTLYKQLILLNNGLKEKEELRNFPDREKELREQTWDALKALTGLGKVPSYDGNRKLKGILQTVAGDSPKTGFFQSRIMKRRQELSMRSTIVPGPDMGIDEVGLPKNAAFELFKPFTIRQLIRSGKDILEAKKEVKEGTPIAWRALEQAIKDRPVLLKRDPVLHKYNVQAFKVKLVEGNAIATHPLLASSFNFDHDGDTMAVHLPLTEQARQEALDKMLPSKNLFSSTNYGIMHAPDQEAIIGLNDLSHWGEKKNKKYNSLEDLIKNGKGYHDVVTVKIDGHEKETTRGRALLTQFAPQMDHSKLLHDPSFSLKKSSIHKMLEDFARKDPKGYPTLVDDWRQKGNDRAHEMGFSFGLSDLHPLKEKRDAILKPYHEEAAKIQASDEPQEKKDEKIVHLYNKATEELDEKLTKDYRAMDNKMFKMVDTKARGSVAQFRQTVIAPMLMVDANNRPIPVPITKSYSEGLDVSQYWTSLHGARKGTLQRAQGTSQPGTLAKEIVNLNIATPITTHDCGSERGLVMNIHDSKGHEEKDIHDRLLAKDHTIDGVLYKKNSVVTPEIVNAAKKANIESLEVRSPLTCGAPQGICKSCFGLNENGHLHEVGTNIGVIASQALSEPAVQLAMDAFHCNHAYSVVFLRHKGKISCPTMEEVFLKIEAPIEKQGSLEFKTIPPGIFQVWDGEWVDLLRVSRHAPDAPMIALGDTCFLHISQETHKITKFENLERCIFCDHPTMKEMSPSAKKRWPTANKKYCGSCKKYQEKKPEAIDKTFALIEGKNIQLGDYNYFNIWPILNTTKDIDLPFDGYSIAAFLAEGCVFYTKRKDGTEIPKKVDFAQFHEDIRQEIALHVAKTAPLSINKKGVQINRAEWARWFAATFPRYSPNKALPSDFLSYSDEWLWDFLAGMIDTDGNIDKAGDVARVRINSNSFVLLQQIQLIALKFGMTTCLLQGDKNRTHIRGSKIFKANYQPFILSLNPQEEHRSKLSASVKMKKLSDHKLSSGIKKVKYNGHRKFTTKAPSFYHKEFVYDFTTTSGTLVVSGMKVSNSGGVSASRGGASGSKLGRLEQLLNLPKTLPYSATLAKTSGKVTSIEKDSAGGHDVLIQGAKKESHYVPSYADLKVEVGHEISKGDPISTGPINPHQLLQLKDMGAVRKYLTKEMGDMYKEVGGVRRRNVEVVVKNLTNLTEVVDPGKSVHLSGDILPTSIVEAHNKTAKSDEKILHKPILRGIKEAALLKNEDFFDRMNFQRIQNTLVEGAGKMWRTKTKNSLSPIGPFVTSNIGPQTPDKAEY